MMKADVVLKDGTVFNAQIDGDRVLSSTSLTSQTLQYIISQDGRTKLIVQGDSILYIKVYLKD